MANKIKVVATIPSDEALLRVMCQGEMASIKAAAREILLLPETVLVKKNIARTAREPNRAGVNRTANWVRPRSEMAGTEA